MDFVKKEWQFRDIISENELNRMEDGIEEGITKAEQAQQIANEAKATADDVQSELSAHISATTGVHGATSAATANRIVQRDSSGRAKFAAPAASDDAARKAEVDAVQTNLNNHANATTGVHGATSAATPNTIIQRDSSGRAKVAAPAAADDIARKDTVDQALASFGLGTTVQLPGSTDWDTINKTGFYRLTGSTAEHAPTDGADHDVIHIQAPNGDATQIAFPTQNRAFFRVKDDGTTWGQWNELAIKNDYVRVPGYAATSGSANNYTVTLNPAPTSYTDGMCVAVKINVANTGAATLNVNGLGARALKKPNGSDFASGELRAGSIYTFRYSTTAGNFILQGEGGDFSVGDTITDVRLLPVSGGMGAEIWSKTDVSNGYGIAVDSAGNVYCAHDVSSGKAIRKLNSSGNEIWSKTDVSNGMSVAVDSAGNVYCAHYVSSGNKAIRKLNSSGNEVWSKTDVGNGWGIAVDSAGNVYCAHGVLSGKAIRKLDSSGNEVWYKTDVENGMSVAVDSVGNVYCAHFVVGGKAIRKLDSYGNEVWYKTDVRYGRGIAVDSAGNVYCAHDVSSGEKAIRKLDGKRYFRII